MRLRLSCAAIVALLVAGCAPAPLMPGSTAVLAEPSPAPTESFSSTRSDSEPARDDTRSEGTFATAGGETQISTQASEEGSVQYAPSPTPEVAKAAPELTAAPPVPSARPDVTAPTGESGWHDIAIDVIAHSDVDALAQISPEFRDYAREAMESNDTDGCTVLGISIMSMHPDGFVLGGISTDCGGGQAIWSKATGSWTPAIVMQAPPTCSELATHNVPPGLGLLCDSGTEPLTQY